MVKALHEVLMEQQKAGYPVMPLLFQYCDNSLFELYAGRFNAYYSKGASEHDELKLLNEVAEELWLDNGNPQHKFICNVTDNLILFQ